MDRRRLLTTGGALAALSGVLLARQARASALDDLVAPWDLKTAARQAWLYCLPLVEMATTRSRMLGPDPTGMKARVNGFVSMRDLAGPATRTVTTPNNDTLYSSAWIDLAAGPVRLTLPFTGARYFSVALMDMFSNNFAVLGARTTGGEGGSFIIAGPRDPAPPGAIRSPTPWVWALARTLVDGEADLPAAHAVQDGLAIKARPGRMPDQSVGRSAAWNDYFLWAQTLLEENPPPVTDTAFFRRIAPLQLGMTGGFERARFADSEMGQVEQGVAEARQALLEPRGRQLVADGWSYPPADLGDFGQDYDLRAAVALGGLAALPPAEAMYLRAIAPGGGPIFRDGRLRLRLPADVPVDGFWSLTMYEATDQGQLFLTDNPINRYSLGDRTPGLARNADGGIDIYIQRTDPGEGRRANWLPAPAQGPFALTFRAYLPKPALVRGAWRLPALEDLDAAPAAPAVAKPAPPPAPAPRRRKR
ncbi:DUF1254 domain-containing protein [Caulobacter sp. KR2-114]|uniref:DUF1254 domain-containing protein n=1 Tax=Caulobacter sp. KR2-114 TaxID=3400912 RepID=UPI003BFBE8B3